MAENDTTEAAILKDGMSTAAFAFRGYDQTNLGRTPELLKHPVYGATVEKHLRLGSELFLDVTGRFADLVARVRTEEDTTLETYDEAIVLIIATELAQLDLLRDFHGIELTDAPLACGYSLGEVSALVATGVYEPIALLRPLLTLAPDLVSLAQDVKLGILFSRGPALDPEVVKGHCLRLSCEGKGRIAISSYLSPNTMLIMGQGDRLDVFRRTIRNQFDFKVHLRPNDQKWPPIHTPITQQKNIRDRAATMLLDEKGGFVKPSVPILSCITGQSHGYSETNSRSLLTRWVDEPQKLWDVVDGLLNRGVETLIHVGPTPNIIPATFNRLTNNVMTQLSGNSLSSLGLRAISGIVRRSRPWLASLLSKDAALLRAPFVRHVILEDWLLENAPEPSVSAPVPADVAVPTAS